MSNEMTEPFLIEFVPASKQGELDRLYTAMVAAQKDAEESATPLRVGDDDPVAALSAEYAELRASAVVPVMARPLTRRDLRALKEKYPPRTEGHEDDQAKDRLSGLNVDAAEDEIAQRGMVDPCFGSLAEFDDWADERPPGMVAYVAVRIWAATTGFYVDPKSAPASPTRS